MATIELPALFIESVTSVVALSRPLLVNRDPAPDEASVPLSAPIILELIDTGQAGVDRGSVRVWVNGALAFEGGGEVEHLPAFDSPRAMTTETAGTLRITLDPVAPLLSLASYQIQVHATIIGGEHVLDESYVFVAEDRTAPQLVAAQATSPRTITLGFDEAVQVTDTRGFILTPLEHPAVPLRPVSATVNGTLVTLTVNTEMTPDVGYRLIATGITDLNDNPIGPPHDAVSFSGFRPPHLASRRFDLWSMLPRHNRRTDATGDLHRFIGCLQELTDLLLAEIDRFPDIFDLERAPEPFLELILNDLGNPFHFDLDVLGKRRLASVLVEMYRQKGTAVGIENAIRFFLGVDAVAITALSSTCLTLGDAELGVNWSLGPSTRFARYAFDLEVNRPLSVAERHQIRTIVNDMKPAHTHFIELIEPSPPQMIDHWVLSVSEVGLSTFLH